MRALAAAAAASGLAAAPARASAGLRDPFVAAPGRQAAIFGSAAGGLEVWAYPLQLLSGYRLRFQEDGRVTPLDAAPLLARVERRGREIIRVFVGPDFVVRERLIAAAHAPEVVLAYEVEGRAQMRIEASFRPSLDMMWPGALGGQSIAWDPARSGYVETEALHRFSALIHSPEAVEHDSTVNAAERATDTLALVLQPRAASGETRRAQVFVSARLDGGAAGEENALPSAGSLLQAQPETDPALAASLRITTPDPEVNRSLLAAEAAIDQAWVCAPDLGCGIVGGYGPSRPGRRPQYAWFFAGDGLVAAEALIATSRMDRARDELAFVANYQDRRSGMIWHEISLSAPLIDWARRYPYMFVHVDITYRYLATLADYLRASGDRAFIMAHWAGIQAAWRYGRSLVDPGTGLPTIPTGKEGQNEQARLRDDAQLSSAFIDAADGMAALARAAGQPASATEAEAAAARARRAVASQGWDAAHATWVGGHTLNGAAVTDTRSDATRLLQQDVFDARKVEAALDRLATPAFQTDWGVRSQSATAPDYDPNAYANGAVWALGTSAVATAFWAAHRPLVAWAAWRGLASWSTLETPGRMHEVLAGDLYHPEIESVPVQTWSSAGLLTSAVHGLFGLEVDGAAAQITFAPHLPGAWDRATLDNLRVGSSRLTMELQQNASELTLKIRNSGPGVRIAFAPSLPLGARLLTAAVNGRTVAATLERHGQEEDARLAVAAPQGSTAVVVRYVGGVRLAPELIAPSIGDHSRNLQVAAVSWTNNALRLRAYLRDPDRAHVTLRTALKASSVEGGRLTPAPDGYVLTLDPQGSAALNGYTPAEARVTFSPP